MKKAVITALLLLCVFAVSGIAHARKSKGVDMEEYTCRDLMQEKAEDIGLVLMWVDGYLSCETGDLKMDEDWIQEMAETIGNACQNDPDAYLIDIVEKMAEQ